MATDRGEVASAALVSGCREELRTGGTQWVG
jgi:hypothetical protein